MKAYSLIIPLLLTACNSDNPADKWEKLDMGNFTIEVPNGSKVEDVKSIDSYVAKIKGKGFILMFDYGMYSSKMTLTDEEYLMTNDWKYKGDQSILSAVDPLPTVNSIVKLNDSTYRVKYNFNDCLRDDSCNYYRLKEAFDRIFTIKDSIIETDYTIHSKLKNYDFILSDKDSIYKRVFIAKNINKFKSGVYMVNKRSCEDESNCTEQLSIWTVDSIKVDSNILRRIFESVKLK